MPVRPPDVRAASRENQRAFRFGDLLELVMLEERLSARSQQLVRPPVPTPFGNGFVQAGAFADPARTLLGDEQEAWLAERLRTTPARWKFLGQGVMFAQLKLQGAPLAAGGGVFLNSDQWDGYQPARDRIYDIIKGDASSPGGQRGGADRRHPQQLGRRPDAGPEQPQRGHRRLQPGHRRGLARGRVRRHFGQSAGPERPRHQHGIAAAQRQPALQVHRPDQRGYMLLDVTRERGVRVVVCRHGGTPAWHVSRPASGR
jgi:alkaline phosphatase D